MDQNTIEQVVRQVVRQLQSSANGAVATPSQSQFGVYGCVDSAVKAATRSQQQLAETGLETRQRICDLLKRIPRENKDHWGRIELEESKVGRLDHKIAKLELLENVPAVEFLKTAAHSGDNGISLDEAAPFGVIGCVTPVTHSIPTLTANAIHMIAAGNALVINAHPSGYKCAVEAVRTYNQAIFECCGISDLICILNPPTLRTAEEIFRHPDLPLLVVTGGPAVAKAALKQPKRAIVAGPGNPPVVVDETADLKRAAESILAGGGFDNNLLCIGEKEVFVVQSVFREFMDALSQAGGAGLNANQVQRLTAAAFPIGDDGKPHVSKDLVGQSCDKLAAAAGTQISGDVPMLFGQVDESNPFVPQEQMMPFLPVVSVPDVDVAIAKAIQYEHGFGHTAIIHSRNTDTITRMGRQANTTIFVANGPSTAGLGIGGEGYPSFSIATPTGEGITTPLTFTRFRRATISGGLRIV